MKVPLSAPFVALRQSGVCVTMGTCHEFIRPAGGTDDYLTFNLLHRTFLIFLGVLYYPSAAGTESTNTGVPKHKKKQL